ncbi:conserved hypothetical protein [Nitrospira defluvii]|uniref:Uncharacterized protein n=2 Tax=Nitrospira TaxID=1234 RepID=A0A0K2GEY5_NITMO|nr:hypothetical protein NITMOv2_3121 [Nitrospira moscoviensis]CAE6734029.1 conserved hypothetical protein [Nitrospira defluvii]
MTRGIVRGPAKCCSPGGERRHLVYTGSPQAFYTALERDHASVRHSRLFQHHSPSLSSSVSHQSLSLQ